jgi:hypothetical protein
LDILRKKRNAIAASIPSALKDAADRESLISLAGQMLLLHQLLAVARTGHERTALERQIEATDGQIDRMVYELYGLTEEEIGIVEAASR